MVLASYKERQSWQCGIFRVPEDKISLDYIDLSLNPLVDKETQLYQFCAKHFNDPKAAALEVMKHSVGDEFDIENKTCDLLRSSFSAWGDRRGHYGMTVNADALIALMSQDHIRIMDVLHSENTYGEFIFVKLCSGDPENKRQADFITFWGWGWHENRGYWKSEFTSDSGGYFGKQTPMNKQTAIQRLRDLITENPEYNRGKTAYNKAFSLIAELTDDDGAFSELQDNPDFENYFEDDE